MENSSHLNSGIKRATTLINKGLMAVEFLERPLRREQRDHLVEFLNTLIPAATMLREKLIELEVRD